MNTFFLLTQKKKNWPRSWQTLRSSLIGEQSCAKGVDGNQNDLGCSEAGSAYVFSCESPSGSCMQVAYLKASNTDSNQGFGKSVAVSANSANTSTVVVGAWREASCAAGVDGTIVTEREMTSFDAGVGVEEVSDPFVELAVFQQHFGEGKVPQVKAAGLPLKNEQFTASLQ